MTQTDLWLYADLNYRQGASAVLDQGMAEIRRRLALFTEEYIKAVADHLRSLEDTD